ncbi:Shedu anti-phage system protein SduA domain-containing protein [Nocardia takedensis]
MYSWHVTENARPRTATREARKRLLATFGARCLIPNCASPTTLPDGTLFLEVAHIVPISGSGPRAAEVNIDPLGFENLILLCPTHHLAIDRLPSEYSAADLVHLREDLIGSPSAVVPARVASAQAIETLSRLERALGIWRDERTNASEEFWQALFTSRPELLNLVTRGHQFVLNSKCYVGGKAISNRGGHVVDFLAQCAGDAILVEIKPPTAKLLGGMYRTNIYPPSHELAGAVAQALNYRFSLLNELPTLRMSSPGLSAYHPQIVIIAGDVESENFNDQQRRSFELYRRCMKDVLIVAYDELFASLADVSIFMEPDGNG